MSFIKTRAFFLKLLPDTNSGKIQVHYQPSIELEHLIIYSEGTTENDKQLLAKIALKFYDTDEAFIEHMIRETKLNDKSVFKLNIWKEKFDQKLKKFKFDELKNELENPNTQNNFLYRMIEDHTNDAKIDFSDKPEITTQQFTNAYTQQYHSEKWYKRNFWSPMKRNISNDKLPTIDELEKIANDPEQQSRRTAIVYNRLKYGL